MATMKDRIERQRQADAYAYAIAAIKQDAKPVSRARFRAGAAKRVLDAMCEKSPWLKEALPLMEGLATVDEARAIAKELEISLSTDLARELYQSPMTRDVEKAIFGEESMKGHGPPRPVQEDAWEKMIAASKLLRIMAEEEVDD